MSCMSANGYPFNTGCSIATEPTGSPDCFALCPNASKGAGVITFSKFPITETQFEAFNDASGCSGNGADCGATKGILLTNIEIEGCEISVINTHLDADNDDGSAAARLSQLEQIRAFINLNVPDNQSLFFGGDFNIDLGATLNNAVGGALKVIPTNSLANVTPTGTASAGQVLDHIFVKQGDGKIIQTNHTVLTNNASTIYCYWTFTDAWFQQNKHDFAQHYENINGVPHEPTPPGYVPNGPEEIGQWDDPNAIPQQYQADVEEKCVQGFVENPSDHNPVLACFIYDCGGEIVPPEDDGDPPPPPPQCETSDDCMPWEQCLNGICVPL